MDINDYKQAGGSHQIIAQFFIGLVDNYPQPYREIARDILKLLVSSYGTKNQYSISEIVRQLPYPDEDIQEILDRLLIDRLISRTTGDQFELVHDYLASQIRQNWLSDAELSLKQVKEMLRNWLTEWEIFGHEKAEHLIDSPQLEMLRAYADQIQPGEKELNLIILSCLVGDVDPSPWIRQMNTEAAVELLSRYCKTGRADMRIRATRALIATHSEKAIRHLDHNLHDHDNAIQKAAAESLRELGLNKGVHSLKAALQREHDLIRVAPIINALSTLGGPDAVAALSEVAENNTGDRRIKNLAQRTLESFELIKPADFVLDLLLRRPEDWDAKAGDILRKQYSASMFTYLISRLVDYPEDYRIGVSGLLVRLTNEDYGRAIGIIAERLKLAREKIWDICVELVANLPSDSDLESALAILLSNLYQSRPNIPQSMVIEPEVRQLSDGIVSIILKAEENIGVFSIVDLPWDASRPMIKILEDLFERGRSDLIHQIGIVLSQMNDPAAVRLLLGKIIEQPNLLSGIQNIYLSSSDTEFRYTVINIIGEMNSQAGYEISQLALLDSDPSIRVKAIHNLPTRAASDEMIESVLRLMPDSNLQVHEAVLDWLLQIDTDQYCISDLNIINEIPQDYRSVAIKKLFRDGRTFFQGNIAAHLMFDIHFSALEPWVIQGESLVLLGYCIGLLQSAYPQATTIIDSLLLPGQREELLDLVLEYLAHHPIKTAGAFLESRRDLEDDKKRYLVAKSMALLHYPALLYLVNDKDSSIRNLAIRECLLHDLPIPIDTLGEWAKKEILQDEQDHDLVIFALSRLAAQGESTRDILEKVISTMYDPDILGALCSQIIQVDDPMADEILAWMTDLRFPFDVRTKAIAAMGDRATDLSASHLSQLIQHPDPLIRDVVINAAGELPHPWAFKILKQAMENPDRDTRREAQLVLLDKYPEDLALLDSMLDKESRAYLEQIRLQSLKSLSLLVKELAKKYAVDERIVLDIVEDGLAGAYGKAEKLTENQIVKAKIDPESGKTQIFIEKTVVEEIENPVIQISISDATVLYSDVVIGQTIPVDVTPKEFSFTSAQLAQKIIQQKLSEIEHRSQLAKFQSQVGQIVAGTVKEVNSTGVLVSLEFKQEGFLTKNQQIKGERYRVGDRIRGLLLEVDDTSSGMRIVLSRAHRDFLRRLLEYEVPEIYRGEVEIRGIAREPGQRSKVAVTALQPGIDPVGACVGIRGVRIQSIVRELNGEKIDVIEWNPDPALYITKALSPSRVVRTYLRQESGGAKIATVLVPDDQLSLAIGRDGQNARLAAKLTSWRIDIKSLPEAAQDALSKLESNPDFAEIAQIITSLMRQIKTILAMKSDKRRLTPEENQVLTQFLDQTEFSIIQQRSSNTRVDEENRNAIRTSLPSKAFEIQLNDFDISDHIYTIISQAGYKTVGDLLLQIKIDRDTVLSLIGMGPKAMDELENALAILEVGLQNEEMP